MKPYLVLPALVFVGLELSLPLSVHYVVAACLLMVMGLPHGAFDIALEHRARSEAQLPPVPTFDLIALYVAIAGVMAGLWLVAPICALLLFFLLSFEHFSEDLRCGLDPWIARASAAAIVTAPVIWHRPELQFLFGSIVGGPSGIYFAQGLLIIAPTAIAIAVAGVAMLIADAHYREAAKIVVVIATMLALPPIIAFTAYFCFDHAPHYLKSVDDRLGLSSSPRTMLQAVGFSLISLAAALALALALPHTLFFAASIKAAFITLSVLTLPHMTMPYARAWSVRRKMLSRQPILAARG